MIGQYDWDIVTVKYNTLGQEQWRRTYDGTGHGWDTGQSLTIDNQGSVYVTGRAATQPGPYEYYFDIVTIKYSPNGDEQLVRLYDGFGSDDCAYDVKVDMNKNVYVCGFSIGFHPPSSWDDDAVVVKYDSLGNQLWVARYNGQTNEWDWFYSLAISNDGSVYATGYTDRQYPNRDYITIKYPSSGPGVEEKNTISKKTPKVKTSPNPFQNQVRIDVDIPSTRYPFDIKIYKIDGGLVKTYDKITIPVIYWDGKDDANNLLPASVYFIHLNQDSEQIIERLVIVK